MAPDPFVHNNVQVGYWAIQFAPRGLATVMLVTGVPSPGPAAQLTIDVSVVISSSPASAASEAIVPAGRFLPQAML